MKLRFLISTGSTLILAAQSACDGGSSAEAGVDPSPGSVASASEGRPDRNEIGVRSERAFSDERAFSETASTPTRFETRIGLQPWPQDVAELWPRPAQARVLADAHQRDGGRLLVIDLPESLDRALASYRIALEAQGFDVVAPRPSEAGETLRARRGEAEAILRFFAREETTRLEILFIGPRSG